MLAVKQVCEGGDCENSTKEEVKAELDRVTALLCSTMQCLESGKKLPEAVGQWWQEHQVLDEKRLANWLTHHPVRHSVSNAVPAQ
jgi:hypothetical protein